MFDAFGPRAGLFIETDYSRFDQTILPELMEIEHEVYLHYYDTPEMRDLLKMQLHTQGVHVQGPAYRRIGGRCSGDANTSIGNCIINLFVAFCAHKIANQPLIGFVEGDDGLFRYHVGLDKIMINVAEDLGLSVKLEATSNPKFCGRYHTADWTSHVDLARCLNKFSVTVNMNDDPLMLLAMKCYSLLSTDPGHPILNRFLTALLDKLEWPQLAPKKRKFAPNYNSVYESFDKPADYGVTMSDVAEQGFTVAYLTYLEEYLYDFAANGHQHKVWLSDPKQDLEVALFD
jgi:hypothetical protein